MSTIEVSCALNPEQHMIKQRPVHLIARCLFELIPISLNEENEEHIDWIEEDKLNLTDVQYTPNKDV